MGYINYSMSHRAADAYDNGEMPMSKWTKSAIMAGLEADDLESDKLTACKRIPLADLKRLALTRVSWHHTSCHYNKTDFFAVDSRTLDMMTIEDILAYGVKHDKQTDTTDTKPTRKHGTIRFLEWSGTRKHPHATECQRDGWIEEKGSFYLVFDTAESETPAMRKKIDSKGTNVIYSK